MSDPVQPLSATWRQWIEQNVPQREDGTQPPAVELVPDCDAIVVGSGYGGSVAALRLAEKGYRVLLLERGSEYLAGEFPNDFSQLPKHLRANVPGHGLPLGRASGLFEFTVGQGMVAIGGNGLGGGSLINAGVVMEPDADVFAQDAWPVEIRHGMGSATSASSLQGAFALAQATLNGNAYTNPAGGQPLKTRALQKAAGKDHPLNTVQLTMDPARCRQCGDCASGCNVPGAKGDLTATYLKQAVATGRVQVITQAEVYRFEQVRQDPQCPTGSQSLPPPGSGWRVWVFSTDAQHAKTSRREAGTVQDFAMARDRRSTLRVLKTPMLFICAGTVGSTQLLQRAQALAGNAMSFSPALGTRLSGNGDSISVLSTPDDVVSAVGHGADPDLLSKDKAKPTDRPHIVGPTITASLDLRDKSKPLAQRLLLQDGAIPGALSRVFAELLATTQTLDQLDRWAFWRGPAGTLPPHESDPLGASARPPRHAQVWLTMGHDDSNGRMVWMPGTDGSALVLAAPEQLETYKEQAELFKRLGRGGVHLHNPLWQALPESAIGIMSGEPMPRWITTVHPLGGCPMGDEPGTSVVNHLGQVWVHDPGFPGRTTAQNDRPPNAPQVYLGLFVLDASIIPTSLGCNPLLTITELDERAMQVFPPRETEQRPFPKRLASPPRSPLTAAFSPATYDVHLKERLSARTPHLKGTWVEAPTPVEVVLQATLSTPDLTLALAESSHRFDITRAQLDIAFRGNDASAPSPCDTCAPVVATVRYRLCKEPAIPTRQERAHFYFLPATPLGSSGWWPVLRTLVEVSVVLVSLCLGGYAVLDAMRQHEWGLGLLYTGLTGLLLLLWCFVLPFCSTVLTWLVLRGWFDLKSNAFIARLRQFLSYVKLIGRARERRTMGHWVPHKNAGEASFFARLRSYAKQMIHATERREMRYWLPMERQGHAERNHFPSHILLTAHKTVMYRASADQWVRWIWRHLRRTCSDDEVPPLRPTYWEQLMDAQVTVRDRSPGSSGTTMGPRLLHGELKMGLDNLFSQNMAQLGARGDTSTGLLMLGGYVLLATRFALKTRLFDFRLPAYSEQPVTDQASVRDNRLRWKPDGQPVVQICPILHTLNVPRGASSSDTGEESVEDLQLRLWRYPRRDATHESMAPASEEAHWRSVPVTRVKSILLLHAFGQSGLSYTYKAAGSTSGSNLAEAFYNAGYEVWVLDSRMSTRSGHAERPSNVDMQGRYDVPDAVDYILAQLRPGRVPKESAPPVQISVFGQCIGSAALWMAALSGRLHHNAREPDTGLQVPKIAAAMFSQVHALMAGTPVTRSKTWIPTVLQRLYPYVPFAVRGPQTSMVWQLLDRLFSSLPVPAAERQLYDNEDGQATCRRIRFIEAPLFKHVNMEAATIADMNRLFGPANLRLFAHARRFVDQDRLVDEDGFNRYVTDAQLRDHLTFPIQLLHGRDNELFDVRSACRTHQWLRSSPNSLTPEQPLLIDGYGHLDVLLGQRAAQEVFAKVLAFFDSAHELNPTAKADAYWRLVAPAVGPFVGWVRNGGGTPVVRVSCILDDWHGGDATDPTQSAIVVRLRLPASGSNSHTYERVAAQVHIRKVTTPEKRTSQTTQPVAYRAAWIDVQPNADQWVRAGEGSQGLEFQLLTLHKMELNPPSGGLEACLPWSEKTTPDADLTSALALNAADCDRFNQNAHINQDKPRRSLQDRMAFSVPTASWQALRADQSTVEFLASCCRYPGLTVDQERIDHALRDALQSEPPAFALMVGDQIYADATAGLTDPISPVERYFERHATAFGAKGMGAFLSRVPTYMTPDDHEWIDNYSQASPLFQWAWPDWRHCSPYRQQEEQRFRWATRSMTSFQRLQVLQRWKRFYTFGPVGPVRLFVMDTRYSRQRDSHKIVSTETLNALQIWLQSANADQLAVIVTGSVVLPGLVRDADPANPGVIDNWQYAPAQRQELLDMLVDQRLNHKRRFLLLSGDYHVSAALEIQTKGQTVGAAVVAPPLYAPLPYVNAKPDHLNLAEPLHGMGLPLTLHAPPNGEPRSGSGLAQIRVERKENNGFCVTVVRDLRLFNESSQVPPDPHTATLNL